MPQVVNINNAQERKTKDDKISELIDEIEIVVGLVAGLKKVERYSWSRDRQPEVVADMVFLKARNRFLTNKLSQLKG
jgi:hypothetical protein